MNEKENSTTETPQPPYANPPAEDTPPPVPEMTARNGSDGKSPQNGQLAGFAEDFRPLGERATPFGIVDALLKHPARAVYEISRGDMGRVSVILLVVAAVCAAAYGAIMGSFSGGPQWWVVPVKVLAGTLLSALICLPSLYILTSLSGGKQSFAETAALLLLNLTMSGILLVGFAPIAWVFSQSTNATSFMGGLHFLFWIAATYFSLRLVGTAFSFLNKRTMGVLTFWSWIFMAVVLQMCTTLRPLVGEFQGYELQEKQFFLEHWDKCLGH